MTATIYSKMDYRKIYEDLIESRRNRILSESTYTENHHIVMKSMGGSDDPENKIRLTPREHFLAHWLLWRIHRNRQTAYAFNAFRGFFSGKNHMQHKVRISSRAYAEAKEAYSILHSERMKGKTNTSRSKVVIQMDLDGNFIQEWPSAKEAERSLGVAHVSDVCRGERKWAGGFTWKYKNPSIKKSKPYKRREVSSKPNKPRSIKAKQNLSSSNIGRKWYYDENGTYFLTQYSYEYQISLGAKLKPGRKNKL